jgi:hypothetical protein
MTAVTTTESGYGVLVSWIVPAVAGEDSDKSIPANSSLGVMPASFRQGDPAGIGRYPDEKSLPENIARVEPGPRENGDPAGRQLV